MADSDEFWKGLEKGELWIQACRNCGRYQHFPRARCHFCSSPDHESRNSNGRGRLVTYSTVWRAPSPEFQPIVPYVLGIVHMDVEDVQIMARILDEEDALHIDMAVIVGTFKSPLGPTMPAFRPLTDSERVSAER